MFRLYFLSVLSSILRDDDPLGSKHVALYYYKNKYQRFILTVYTKTQQNI